MKDRKHAGIGAAASQVRSKVDALEPFGQHGRRKAAHPFVEVTEYHLWLADSPIVDDGAEAPRLVAPLEKRRAQVHVVEVQRVVAERDVDALAAAWLARLPGEV